MIPSILIRHIVTNVCDFIEAAFQSHLAEEKLYHEREQQLEVQLSRERHDGDLKEKYRLARVMEHKMEFQQRVVTR
ncbi:hypothetical protein L2E82_32814 [Cichorium intybus]|uniref:Uncharacterized protein n=1 Tax=Cichorium intybus TaxID=13427 RepID=A0ACB9BIP1_CICIN|nr:hypothetical protein L2E82_32814 [Cichorium intybus]